MSKNKSKLIKISTTIAISLCIAYLLLLILPSEIKPPSPGDHSPFIWNQDDYWSYLESEYMKAKAMDMQALADSIDIELAIVRSLLDSCEQMIMEPSSPILSNLEKSFFELCPFMAAKPDRLNELIILRNKLRRLIKKQSQHWDMNSPETRDRLYRLLFGTRIAIEEIILQSKDYVPEALSKVTEEPSATPSAEILGVTIHSGDILVSRGGAPTSALIARGNDYPGNFSHIALVHVDENSGKVSIIESHIEKGVAIASPEGYLRDTKLRILFLRLRSDHPLLIDDPMLSHKAAEKALSRSLSEHIPYDFAMDFNDDSKFFCSEVASNAYAQLGVKLWMGLSNISSPGVRSWLAAFGVRHFETQEPSDLEYDPQLSIVAEWNDPELLYKDHLDNAVIDIMLEDADDGEDLTYNRFMLPVARVMKAYSSIKNIFGGIGPIPEGMDAAAALKNDRFSKKHDAIKYKLIELAEAFQSNKGYRPPYWELVKLARQAKNML